MTRHIQECRDAGRKGKEYTNRGHVVTKPLPPTSLDTEPPILHTPLKKIVLIFSSQFFFLMSFSYYFFLFLPPLAHPGPDCLLSPRAPPDAQRQPGLRYGYTHKPSRGASKRTLRLRSPRESNARPQAQRARAARCAVNNTAPGRQPAATVPSRRSSDWRPGPTRLHFNSAPRGVQKQPGLGTPAGETPRTSKPRPATRAR